MLELALIEEGILALPLTLHLCLADILPLTPLHAPQPLPRLGCCS